MFSAGMYIVHVFLCSWKWNLKNVYSFSMKVNILQIFNKKKHTWQFWEENVFAYNDVDHLHFQQDFLFLFLTSLLLGSNKEAFSSFFVPRWNRVTFHMQVINKKIGPILWCFPRARLVRDKAGNVKYVPRATCALR